MIGLKTHHTQINQNQLTINGSQQQYSIHPHFSINTKRINNNHSIIQGLPLQDI
jgi:hypothetical protein